MAHQGSHRYHRAGLCIVAIVLLLGLPTAADEPQKTLSERMEREMLRFQVQIQNARMRLEQGLVGVIDEGADPEAEVTPMRACCAVNLQKMRGAVKELGVIFDELERCHREAENHGAVSAVAFARVDLAEFARATGFVAEVPNQNDALAALSGLTRLYFGLLESVEAIEGCPGAEQVAPAPDPGAGAEKETEKKNKKKDRKKREIDEGSAG
jgi:hypothetical protein